MMINLLSECYLAVVQRVNDGERLATYSLLFDELTTILERLLNDKSHTFEVCTSLLAEVDDAEGSIAVSEEINFGVNPTKYNTCIKSYLSNNNTSYTMNYSVKVNYNNT